MDVQQSATSSPSVSVIGSCPVLCSTEYGSTDSSPAGEHGSCADNPDLNGGDNDGAGGNQESAGTSDVPGSSARSASPDLNCPICLGRLANRSYTDTCFHKFCFVCLVEWSKVKPVCPLCKQPFTSVIHNVQSYEDFEQLPISSSNSTAEAAAAAAAELNRSRFRYPTTVIRGSSERRRQRESFQRPSRLRRSGTSRFDVPPPAFTSSFRRSIYRDELWVRSVGDSGRYRETSALFFARNPAAVHRLVPWLNREMMALLRNPADVAFLIDVILSTIPRVDVTSEAFYDLVSPFIGARTRHFVHEFHSFARSPFNMEAYDTRSVYERPPQMASTAPIEFSDSSSSESSDTEIVETIQPTTANESEVVVSDDEHAVNEGLFGLRESTEDLSRNRSSPQPGPSYLSDIPLPESLRNSHTQNLSVMPSYGPCLSSVEQPSVENVDEDSDNEIEIVAEDRPWGDRSPVVLSSGDTDADDDVTELLHRATDNGPSIDAQLSADANQDPFTILQYRAVDMGNPTHVAELVQSDVQMSPAKIITSGAAHDPEQSSHLSEHCHKRSQKHKKHRHHRDSSHHRKDRYESHSSSSRHRKHKPHSKRSKLRDADVTNNELKHTVSSSANCTDGVSDSYHVDNQMWTSDDSSDCADSQPVRSVVVVPQTFKKNCSGHKRSTRDSD